MRLYQSNRLENLLAALCAVLAEPAGGPLEPETVVVQNPGMARWLSQQIARQTGICANISFPLPASFIWSLFAKTLGGLPDLREFSKETMLWRLLAELDSLPDDPAMQELHGFLRDDRDGSRRFQLAGRIADLFDQYLVYRHDMVLAWEQGKETHWQARLWRRLTDGGGRHRAEVLERFLAAAEQGILRTEGLPKRVCVFGINSLAPAYVEALSRISGHIDIRIFHFSPCRQAWDDIMPERLIALRRQNWRRRGFDDLSRYYSVGNPLLASLGGLGREFFQLLINTQPVAEEDDLYELPPQETLLGQIQGDILDLRDRSPAEALPLHPADRSVRFHCCHSPMREIQVLHDRLLDLFTADSSLKPGDILVMAPDISRYAAAVAGVFGSAEGRLRIPWSIADQARRDEQPVIEGFLSLLHIVSSRCAAPELAAVLENPIILARFGLTEADVPVLRTRIAAAGIRQGLEQRRGAADNGLHTWEAGLDRLLLGCLTGPLDGPWQEVMPVSGGLHEGGDWLGSLAEFIRSLIRLRRQTARPLAPESWAGIFLRLTGRFLDNGGGEHEEGLLLLRQTIADFAESCRRAAFKQPLSLSVVRRHFQQLLAAPAGGQAFLAGRVTFCNMVPMRSVPFKVIWLLGMNDGDFPRSQRPPAFDLMAAQRRPGDRSRRDDDRYLFLEALLSARSHFAVSWAGRSLRDNKPRPLSTAAAELRDYINRGWRTKDGKAAADALTVEHPLQPFSRKCFMPERHPQTASCREDWLPAAAPAPPAFVSRPLPKTGQFLRQIDLSQLVRFWRHPVRFFLEQRLGLRAALPEELILPESEAFVLDQLQRYQFAEEILLELRGGRELSCPLHRWRAAGGLPGGGFGPLLHQQSAEEAAELLGKVEPLLRQPVEPAEVNLTVDGVRLTGRLTSLCRCGRVTFRPANLKAKDRLQLWIHHLALLLLQPEGVEPCSVHVGKDSTVRLEEVRDPQAELAALISHFYEGLNQPLHFYPESSRAWAKGTSVSAAWRSSYNRKGEGDDPAYEIGLRGHAPFDRQFEELAERLAAMWG
jgi:exodeoxyribonuclease V gamma subunit